MIVNILKNYRFKQLLCVFFDEYLWSICKHIPGIEGLFIRRMYLKMFSKKCGPGVILQRSVHLRSTYNLQIGKNVFINRGVHIDAFGGVEIGEGAALGPHVVIITGDHGFLPKGTMYQKRGLSSRPVIIGNNSMICANSYIGAGVKIGKNCVIAAGTSVLVDVPDNAVISNSPADLYSRSMKKTLKNFAQK
ncbi:MAG: hypothetical protein A2X77_04745 [Gammaproteobacteria bacterium GWE2_42_36]|nr:MAG: hypothetical protein A2X77_04745 [Gammaproteobacteria bacterium GWE2_42_36]